MRNDQGISIILTDSDEEVKYLITQLGVEEAFPLSMLSKVCTEHPEAVYYEVLDTEQQLKTLSQNFLVKRGIISVNGKRSYLGFNVDWMSKTLVTRDLEKAMESTIKKPVALGPFFTEEDRDDPFESLGYSRGR